MELHLVWLLVGIVLVIAELLTGTFYLLLLGIAGLFGAAVAFAGAPFWVQAIVSAACAVIGVLWIQRHRRMQQQPGMPALDVGQPVTLDAWVNRADRLARVRYRDALWDARVSGEIRGEPGEMLYIVGVDGATLHVAKQRQA